MKKLTLLLLLISVFAFGQSDPGFGKQLKWDSDIYLSGDLGEQNGFVLGDTGGSGVPIWTTVNTISGTVSLVSGMKREVLTQNGVQYLKYTPTTLSIKGAVLFLHGMGEKGSDITKVENNDIPKQLKNGLEVPYIVIAPQLPSAMGGWWANTTGPIITMMKGYNLDLHITGLSLGAMDVPTIIGENPGVFKTVATVCGKIDNAYKAKIYAEIQKIPSIHYYDPTDGTIAYGYSSVKSMVDYFKPLGADINLVELKGSPNAHTIWPQAYLPANYWAWLDSKVTTLVVVKDPIVETYLLDGVLHFKSASGKDVIK